MKWTVLVDNRTLQSELETEHGLSILLESEHKKILLDTGASSLLLRNADRLGVDISEVDYVFLSHGHGDHAGGLVAFWEVNTKAKVIVSPYAMQRQFFSERQYFHNITPQWPAIPNERLLSIEESRELADGIHVIAHIPHVHPMPKGNQHLFVLQDPADSQLTLSRYTPANPSADYLPDDFRHEIALYIDGLLFTGCAHSGLENILSACPWPVHSVVGGFHLLDHHESSAELTALAHRLLTAYPDTHFFTSHCTGDETFRTLHSVMGDHLHPFSCGTVVQFPDN